MKRRRSLVLLACGVLAAVVSRGDGGSAVAVRAYTTPFPPPTSRRRVPPGAAGLSPPPPFPPLAFVARRPAGGGGKRAQAVPLGAAGVSYEDERSRAVANSSQYHLVWSPGFWKKFVAGAALWGAVQLAMRGRVGGGGLGALMVPGASTGRPDPSCHATPSGLLGMLPSSVALPLLSSSCCALQLLINALTGWGCAGFNTYLGPVRPLILPALLISAWELFPRVGAAWTALSLSLAFLPELVHAWNVGTAGSRNADGGPLPEGARTLRLEVPSMGCVACVNKIDASIQGCPSTEKIWGERSWLTGGNGVKGGVAEVSILADSEKEYDEVVREIVGAVNGAGFDCTVV